MSQILFLNRQVWNYYSNKVCQFSKLKPSLFSKFFQTCFYSRTSRSVYIQTLYCPPFNTNNSGMCTLAVCWKRRNLIKQNYENTSSFITQKFFSTTHICEGRNDDLEEDEHTLDDVEDEYYSSEFNRFSQEMLQNVDHNALLIVQPYIKWGQDKNFKTSPDLRLQEAVALVESLHGWHVVEKLTIGLQSFHKKTFFGSGNLDMLKQKIRKSISITAVFISAHMLRGIQHRELVDYLGVPVYDRYSVIIQIFKQHAISKEAKLQVAMAEIPYLRSRLRGIHEGAVDRQGGNTASIGGAGETFFEVRKRALERHEIKLKHTLKKIQSHRELLRLRRKKLQYPTVAVVGYTNAGKTSLIKALTGDSKLQPKNQLFATLDVSNHLGILPCKLKVLYVDTIGFISDIPTELLEPFIATLEDAMFADVILHVKDLSHPNCDVQEENVLSTLQRFNLDSSLMENIITAGNKLDLIENIHSLDNVGIPVSAKKHTGLKVLEEHIEAALLRATGRISLTIRVPAGSEEACWLYKEVAVTNVKADQKNGQCVLMQVVMSESQLKRFRHYFINSSR